MKLAELLHQYRNIEKRLGRTYRAVLRDSRVEEETPEEVRQRIAEDFEEVQRLLRRKGELKLLRARTLAAHPDVVDLLASRTRARYRVHTLHALSEASRAERGEDLIQELPGDRKLIHRLKYIGEERWFFSHAAPAPEGRNEVRVIANARQHELTKQKTLLDSLPTPVARSRWIRQRFRPGIDVAAVQNELEQARQRLNDLNRQIEQLTWAYNVAY